MLDHFNRDAVLDIYERAPGSEIASGKFTNPASSAALAANMFGPGISRPAVFDNAHGVALGAVRSVHLEAVVRFPWSGGRHPCLDALLQGDDWLIGVESKRYEPFRGKSRPSFSDAFNRPVWSRLGRYNALRRAIMAGDIAFTRLDAGQLIKHALALDAEADRTGKAPRLLYLFAEPRTWPNGAAVDGDAVTIHRAEVRAFINAVGGDAVPVDAMSYRDVLTEWASQSDRLGDHACAILESFDV